MTHQYIGGLPNMDPYAVQIDYTPWPYGRTVAKSHTVDVPEFRHRRVSPWREVYKSSIVRGLAVAFVLVSCIGVGILIARATA